MKIKPLKLPPIPKQLLGRKREDGKADKRFKNSILVYKKAMDKLNEVSGVLKGQRS